MIKLATEQGYFSPTLRRVLGKPGLALKRCVTGARCVRPLAVAILVTALILTGRASDKKVDVSKIHGRIQFVQSFPDYKVQVVTSFADLHVQIVTSFPDKPGQWQIVESFPDYKIEMVNSFPDFTIQYVKSFPGPTK